MKSRGVGMRWDRGGWRGLCGGAVVVCLLSVLQGSADCQTSRSVPRGLAASTATGDPNAATASRTVTGRVTNGLTGAPIPRALVNISGRAVLTDAQGRFSLREFSQPQAYVRVTKPGYAEAPDGADGVAARRLAEFDVPLELSLLPDGLVTGTVTGADGYGVARVPVLLRTERFDVAVPRWSQAGFTFTDAHGGFRLLAPAGRYRVTTSFAPRTAERGDAVLPVSYPADGEFFELGSGEERRIDLRPRMGAPHPLTVHVEEGGERPQLRLMAIAAAGEEFNLGSRAGDRPGDYVVELPAGNYTIHGVIDNREDSSEGTAKVVVTGRDPARVQLVLAPMPVFSVEVQYDRVAGASAPDRLGSLRSLNLYLRNLANQGDATHPDAQLIAISNGAATFQPRPGRYRMVSAGAGGGWYVKAASVGSTNLMTDELVVGPGAAGSPIQVVLSNAVGRVHGNVATGGLAGAGWVYLIPESDSLVPYFETLIQPDGSFSFSGPVGSYRVVALQHRLHDDIRDPAVRKRVLVNERVAEVTAGTDAAVEVEFNASAEGTR